MRLVSCQGCERHVRAEEAECPFCGAITASPELSRAAPVGRLGRAALFAFGTSIAVASCTPAYGAPDPDAGAADDGGGPAPLYGGVPADAGPGDAGPGDAGGGPAPAYGAAPADGG